MRPELRQLIIRSKFHQGAIQAVAALLPADDAELDALIGETVREKDQAGFIFITMAALVKERKVDACHLGGGAMMIKHPVLLGGVVWHMQGELPEALLHAMEHTMLRPETEAAMLFLMAAWSREQAGRTLPQRFIAHARTFARSARVERDSLPYLLALALLNGDAGLHAVVTERFSKSEDEKVKRVKETARGMGDAFLKVCRQPILNMIPAAPPKVVAEGFTMRRSVARVGRNDPCPCGSGRKHKHCCIAKSEERLHFSTDVAGKTIEELQAEPEPHLTLPKLMKADPHEALRWDPRKIKPELRETYFEKLAAFNLLDRAVEAFERLGWSEDLKRPWDTVVFCMARLDRRDLALRMMKLRPDAAAIEDDLHLSTALLLAEDDAAKQFKILDECAMKALQADDPKDLSGFAYGLLVSKFRGLGVFVARSMIPVLPEKRASRLFEQLLEARDKLNLPPDDPFGEILDARFRAVDPGEGKEADALREAQQRLDAKAKEVELLKEAIDRLHKEVEHREQAPPPATAVAPAAPAPVTDPASQELRRKVEGLKSALKERHHERNELRRELQKAHANLEELRQNPVTRAQEVVEVRDMAESEENLFLPAEPFINQPVRVIEFPKRFQEGLVSLPKAVARSALTTLGRMAAGEPAAFVGVVRLKACNGIFRQRIGSDFRLLFRLHPDRVQVIDLIPRQDLLRRIKTLV